MTICDLSKRQDLLPEIVDLHEKMIPSFRASLGKEHMHFLYEIILEKKLGNIFAALHNDQLAGFLCAIEELGCLNSIATHHMKWLRCIKSIIKNPIFILDIVAHLLFLRFTRNSRILYLAAIATNEVSQGTDTATYLLRKAMEISQSKQKALTALVWKNNSRAINFYKKNGFMITKSFLNIYQVTWKPDQQPYTLAT